MKLDTIADVKRRGRIRRGKKRPVLNAPRANSATTRAQWSRAFRAGSVK